MGGNFKFEVQDSDLEYFILGDWEIWKSNRTFWKKNTFKNQNMNNPFRKISQFSAKKEKL